MFRLAKTATTTASTSAPVRTYNGVPETKLVNAVRKMSEASCATWMDGLEADEMPRVVRAIARSTASLADAREALLTLSLRLPPDLLLFHEPFEPEAAATAAPSTPVSVLLMLDASGSVQQHVGSVLVSLRQLEFTIAGGFGAAVPFTTPPTQEKTSSRCLPASLNLTKPDLLSLASCPGNFNSTTSHNRIIDGVRLMPVNQPFILIIYGDGDFDNVAVFDRDLEAYKAAFAACVYVVFYAMQHTTPVAKARIEAVLVRFCRTVPGCGFAVCTTPEAVNEITAAGRNIVRMAGYNTVLTPDGPLYLLDVPKQRMTATLLRRPVYVTSIGKLIVDMAGNAAAVTLFETDPIFAKLYGCLNAVSRNTADLDTAGIAKRFLADLSRVKSRVTPGSAHEAAIDALIDASKVDTDAYARAVDAQVALVTAAGSVDSLRVLRSMAPITDSVKFKALVREACGDGWMYTDELTRGWLRSWFVERPRGESEDQERVFDAGNPASVELALRLLMGNDIILGPRIALNLALTGTYDFKLATEIERGGLDSTFAALLRSFLAHFRHYDVFGLKRVVDDAAPPGVAPAYDFELFLDSNLVPHFMRTVLRAARDFPGLVPSASPLVPLFQELLRAKAMLELVHGKRTHAFELPVNVYPKSKHAPALCVDPRDVAPAKAAPPLDEQLRQLLRRGGRDFDLLVPPMMGVVLDFADDGISAPLCSGLYTTARTMSLLQKQVEETWEQYWARLPATLRNQVACQCRQALRRGIVPYAWQVAPPVWLVGFPPEALVCCTLMVLPPSEWAAASCRKWCRMW